MNNNKETRLLVVTQKIDADDSNLGSFHDWLKKIANLVDVDVVANYVGKHELPDNVRVFSLGKEKGAGKLSKILRYQLLLSRLMPISSGIFFHMCPEYVIGAGLWAKIFRKKSLLWYAHKSVNFKLKLAEKLVDKIFTPSKESFRLKSEKVEIVGHGINLEKFNPAGTKKYFSKFEIITAGRIAPVKNTRLLIDVAEVLKDKCFNDFGIKIAGIPILESDKRYFKKLEKEIQEKKLEDKIIFVGPIANENMPDFYRKGDLFVNFSDTGSIDRAVLEAMSCGLSVLTSNESFGNVLKDENLTDKNPENIANKIISLAKTSHNSDLREYVFRNHNLDNLIGKIVKEFEKKMPINVLILPSRNKNNKYIELLINSLKDNDMGSHIPDLKKDSVFHILYLICFGKMPKAKNIIHIQWSTILYGSKFATKSMIMLFANMAIILMAKKILKVKIIWTAHNFYAHDYPHPFIDRLGRKLLRTISDCVIVQQQSTFSDYINRYPNKNIKYIPHGNYIGAYGKAEPRNKDFRRSFGFEDNDLVLLSLGAIAPYKLNENIIRSVISLRKKFPRLKLLVVGKGKDEYVDKLRKMTAGDDRVAIINSFVPDSEISKYFSISDYSVFYYDGSEMTSGGIILSLSYGVPVISRAIPGAEMLKDGSGFTFENEEGLEKILVNVLTKFEKKSPDDIIDTVRQFDWRTIAADLIQVYLKM